MNDTYLSDFYHGWLIEITSSGGGFEVICYSPCREKIQDHVAAGSDFEAMQTAKQVINWYLACQTLSGFLRQHYEEGNLNFEEWRSLHQSLALSFKTV